MTGFPVLHTCSSPHITLPPAQETPLWGVDEGREAGTCAWGVERVEARARLRAPSPPGQAGRVLFLAQGEAFRGC